ncbi:Uncharacterised protein [Vibrio cholerae]|nr:Uncharacterised protein [Vibrio cholerae]
MSEGRNWRITTISPWSVSGKITAAPGCEIVVCVTEWPFGSKTSSSTSAMLFH